jgi:hypothetical protein
MPGESNPSLTAVDGYGDTALIASYWLVNMARLLDDRQLTLTSTPLSHRGAALRLCVFRTNRETSYEIRTVLLFLQYTFGTEF